MTLSLKLVNSNFNLIIKNPQTWVSQICLYLLQKSFKNAKTPLASNRAAVF